MFAEKNSIYLIAAYIVFLGSITIYLLSLVIRVRNLKRDEELLRQISEQVAQEQQTERAAEGNPTLQPGETVQAR